MADHPRRFGLRHGLLKRLRTLLAALFALGCAQGYRQPSLHESSDVSLKAQPGDSLKVHMRTGDVYILREWELQDSGRVIRGLGTRFDAFRAPAPGDSAIISTAGVALLESNSAKTAFTFGMFGLGVMTTAGALVSLVCLADPKSCFGSCPTFYVEGDTSRVHAEGFSSSVAKVLEARDIDALDVEPRGRSLAIRMRNEAWETHLVRRVALLAAPRPRGSRVFAAGDSTFFVATNVVAPSRCSAAEGDCGALVAARDGRERFSLTDSTDLAARESIDLRFDATPRRPGLVITARNSLVSTFLFYQTLAYFGRNAGVALATMERGTRGQAEAQFGMATLLGGIDVQVRTAAGWRTVGSYFEHGPIAADTKVIPLPTDAKGFYDVRLVAAKGNWRIDRVALGELTDRVDPVRIEATTVERLGRSDASARRSLRDSSDHLVTLPGDEYRLRFDLPEGDHELFLESEGYYYEWMRREWLAEENAGLAATLVFDPAAGLKLLARAYKQRESSMERLFWASRFNIRSTDARPR